MRTFILDTKNRTAQRADIKPELETYYKIIGCDTIDITNRRIGEYFYDIIVDDEGLYKGDAIPSALNRKGEVQLVGTLIFCGHNAEGDETELDEDHLRNLEYFLDKVYLVPVDGEVRDTEDFIATPVMTGVEYE